MLTIWLLSRLVKLMSRVTEPKHELKWEPEISAGEEEEEEEL